MSDSLIDLGETLQEMAIEFGSGSEDYAQAQWLAVDMQMKWRYDFSTSRWHRWNGYIWAPDLTQQVRKTVANLAEARKDGTQSDVLQKQYTRLRGIAAIDRALQALATFAGYGTDGSDWDTESYLMGAKNGLIDLRTNTLISTPSPEMLVTKTTGRTFVPCAGPDEFGERAPRFMDFLHQVTSQDPEMVDFLLQWFGQSLFGHTYEQRFLLMTGIGRNGKGTLKNTLMNALGDYAAQPDANIYMRSKLGAVRSEAPRADLMDLKGRRVTFFSEPEGGKLNDELLKAHTGGDRISARTLNSPIMVNWTPTHSITFLTNHPPEVEDVGPSMSQRLLVADFRERYEGDNDNKKLQEELNAELDGVLAILAWHASKWHERYEERGRGLVLPERVSRQVKRFLAKGDSVLAFLAGNTKDESGQEVAASRLYKEYLEWFTDSEQEGEAVSQVKFAGRMERRGYKKKKKPAGQFYLGIRMLNAMEKAALDDADGLA